MELVHIDQQFIEEGVAYPLLMSSKVFRELGAAAGNTYIVFGEWVLLSYTRSG